MDVQRQFKSGVQTTCGDLACADDDCHRTLDTKLTEELTQIPY